MLRAGNASRANASLDIDNGSRSRRAALPSGKTLFGGHGGCVQVSVSKCKYLSGDTNSSETKEEEIEETNQSARASCKLVVLVQLFCKINRVSGWMQPGSSTVVRALPLSLANPELWWGEAKKLGTVLLVVVVLLSTRLLGSRPTARFPSFFLSASKHSLLFATLKTTLVQRAEWWHPEWPDRSASSLFFC